MIRNYLTIIFRNLWKNKLYTFINILSLAVGIAAVVWGIQDYRYSFSYDNFHKDEKNIFRVLTKTAGNDNRKGYCPELLAASVKNDFPSVMQAVRWDSRGLNVKAPQNDPFETGAHFTDASFFELFNFPLIRGTSQIQDRSTVLLTESAAKKFFGGRDPIGKTLLLYSDEPFKLPLTVTGILKDPPPNSSIQFDLITNTENQLKPDGSPIKNDEWEWLSDAVFVRLKNQGDAFALSKELKRYVPLQQSARKDIRVTSFSLQPLAKVSDAFDIENNGLRGRPTDAAAFGPIVLAILILLSACLNFANTSVAQSNRRLKEIGVRKVMGSSYKQIMLQQLLECAIIVLFATALSVLFNNFWLPTFNSMFRNVKLEAHYFSDYNLVIIISIIFLLVTLLAGAYPAFYISRFNATSIFRGSVKFGGSNLFSRILLGLQVAISFITVIAAVAFSRNSTFQSKLDYGYEKANVIGVDLQNESAFPAVRDEFSKIPDISDIAGTINNIGFSYYRIPLEAKGNKVESNFLKTGTHYFELMKLKLVAGRSFYQDGTGDYEKAMMINEKLAFQLGWKPAEAIGKQIRTSDTSVCTVVGVMKDFTQNTVFDPILPGAMVLATPDKYARIIVRAKPGTINTVFDNLKAAWAKLYPTKPFRGYYQDEVASEAASVNQSVATIFRWFAMISVLMAATSMFALVSLNVLKRSKEIAIRKVVGAEDRHIFKLVMKGYSWIILLSAIIGCYGGYMLSKLLMDLIFWINAGVSSSSLAISFAGVLIICASTIGARVWMVLRSKTTDALKAQS
jgi:ABC-type antimicrobial peptide transport system permease subunit